MTTFHCGVAIAGVTSRTQRPHANSKKSSHGSALTFIFSSISALARTQPRDVHAECGQLYFDVHVRAASALFVLTSLKSLSIAANTRATLYFLTLTGSTCTLSVSEPDVQRDVQIDFFIAIYEF